MHHKTLRHIDKLKWIKVRVQTFTQVAELPYMSKRFALSRYLGLSEEEMARNADLWAEENNIPKKKTK